MAFLGRKRNPSSSKLSKEFTVLNENGMHARPAGRLVRLTNRFRCEVWVEKDGQQVNGKSIMGLMMLTAYKGSVLKVTCDGEDAADALKEIEDLVARKFDEPPA